MDIITLDFETYYAKDYSLTKLTTEEYIRDDSFEVIGVSVKVNNGETEWYSGDELGTFAFLKRYDWDNSIVVAHNAMFDMAILSWRYNIKPNKIADTLSMGKALHSTEVGGSLKALAEHYGIGEKGTEVVHALGKRRLDFTKAELARYGEYCVNDTELTYKLFSLMAVKFPVSELKLIDLTIRMFTEPVIELNSEGLEGYLESIVEQKAQLLADVNATKKDLMSNAKFAEILLENGATPPVKISPTTGKEVYAFAKTDDGMKALLEHPITTVQLLTSARLGVKSTIEETRTERFLAISKRGPMPVPLRYYAAHTGRWGGTDKINLQNLPRGSYLKTCMAAPEGYTFIDCDSSQIEARTLAWLAEQNDLVDVFQKNNEEVAAGIPKEERKYDPYKLMASSIYGKPIEEIDDGERFVGKQTLLGSGYGMGWRKFKDQLGNFNVHIEDSEAEYIIAKYRETYPMVTKLWKDADRAIRAMVRDQYFEFGVGGLIKVEGRQGIQLPNGLYLTFPNLREVKNDEGRAEFVYDSKKGRATIKTKLYGGKLIENICQAVARIIIGEQLILISKKYRPIMTVHDAGGIIAPIEEAVSAREWVELCMRIRPKWAPDLPLDCESGMGDSYGECK